MPPSHNYRDIAFRTRGPRPPEEAPVDKGYGREGYAYFPEARRGLRGRATQIIASHTIKDRFYTAGLQIDRESTAPMEIFVACLDVYGKLDTTFGDDGKAQLNKSGNLLSIDPLVAEDAAGNLLVLTTVQEGVMRLWKLTSKGKLDDTFGSEKKGYVDIDGSYASHVLAIGERWFVLTDTTLQALEPNGRHWVSFGKNGIVRVDDLPLTGFDQRAYSAMVALSEKEAAPRIAVTIYALEGAIPYALTCALDSSGDVDTSFKLHKSDPWIINYYYGMSVDMSTQLITVAGTLYDLDSDGFASKPAVYRLRFSGAPDLTFNNGEVKLFDIPGGWHNFAPIGKKLVGYGTFFTQHIVVRYNLDGTLDESFMPPNGYGRFGARLGEPGFYSYGISLVAEAGKGRLLIPGSYLKSEYEAACVTAIQLKPFRE